MGCNICKFEIQIKGTKLFHCARMLDGWAELWSHDGLHDPCPCDKKVIGTPTIVDRELPSAEFWKIAGEIITEKDWIKG